MFNGKKIHSKGYHVEWKIRKNKRTQLSKNENNNEGLKTINELIVQETPVLLTSTDNQLSLKNERFIPTEKTKVGSSVTQKIYAAPEQKKDTTVMQNTSTHQEVKTTPSVYEQKYNEPSAISALVFALVLPPIGIIIGVNSLKNVKANPGKYKNESLSKTAVTIGIVFTAIILLPFLVLLLL